MNVGATKGQTGRGPGDRGTWSGHGSDILVAVRGSDTPGSAATLTQTELTSVPLPITIESSRSRRGSPQSPQAS